MIAIDSNVLLRLFVGDDRRLAAEARQIMDKLDQGEALLDRIILAEIGYVLISYYQYTHADVARLYEYLITDPRFMIPDREQVEQTIGNFSAHKELSFEDCWLWALRETDNVSHVFTFDRDLEKCLHA